MHLFLLVQASEIIHYMIAVSEDVAPLKPVSTHLRTATSDLIPEVRKANIIVMVSLLTIHDCCKQLMILLLMNAYNIEYDDAVLHYITQTITH